MADSSAKFGEPVHFVRIQHDSTGSSLSMGPITYTPELSMDSSQYWPFWDLLPKNHSSVLGPSTASQMFIRLFFSGVENTSLKTNIMSHSKLVGNMIFLFQKVGYAIQPTTTFKATVMAPCAFAMLL